MKIAAGQCWEPCGTLRPETNDPKEGEAVTYEDVRIAVLQAASVLGISTDSAAFADAMGVVRVAEADGYDPTLASEIARDMLSRAALTAQVA